MRGRLITIEGIDGAGKTTLADGAGRLRCARGGHDVVLLREPGGVALSERIRELVKDPALARRLRAPRRCSTPRRAPSWSPSGSSRALAGGHLGAARPLRRLLARLPGRGRGLGIEAMRELNAFAHRRPAPRPHAAAARSTPPRARRARPSAARQPDRLEREDDAFFAAIAGAYDALAAAEPERFRVLDAGAEPAAVLAAAHGRAGRPGLASMADARTQGSHRPHVRGRAPGAGRGARQRLRRHPEGVHPDGRGRRLQAHGRRSSRRPRRRRRRTSRRPRPATRRSSPRRPRSAPRAAPRPRSRRRHTSTAAGAGGDHDDGPRRRPRPGAGRDPSALRHDDRAGRRPSPGDGAGAGTGHPGSLRNRPPRTAAPASPSSSSARCW